MRSRGLRVGEATVATDYSARELTVAEGERLAVLEMLGGWYRCRNAAGATGWVPEERVRVADATVAE